MPRVAYTLSILTIYPELHAARPTWHTTTLATGVRVFSAAGRWEMWAALPVLNCSWLRWMWKIGHGTRGLGFLSDAQSNFGLVIHVG